MPDQKTAKSFRKKILIKIIYIWILLFILSVGVLISLIYINTSFNQERQAYERTSKLVDVITYANMRVIELSMQIRSFVINGNSLFIANYWRLSKQVANIKITRKYLKDLNASPEEIDYIFQAKKYMAQTRLIELNAIKLLATAYQIDPKLLNNEIRSYQLSDKNKQMKAKQQVKMAQKMLFSKKYTQQKMQIVNLMSKFQQSVSHRISAHYTNEIKTTNLAMYVLTILLLIQVIAIMSVIWLRSVSLKTRLKRG